MQHDPETILNGYGDVEHYGPGNPPPAPEAKEIGQSPRKFEFTPVGKLIKNLQPTRWLVEGYIEQNTMALAFGDPGSCKSFFAIDIACCIATGTDWHGHKVTQGAVFYIAGEGHNGLARRFKAWEKHYGVSLENVPLYVAKRPAQFYDAANAAAVAEAVQELVAQTGQKPVLIVIDTLARNFGGGDENATKDMNLFVQHVDELKDRWEAAALTIHHTGHGEKNRARGAMALKGALDHEYCVQKNASDIISITNTKTKDGPKPEPLYFEILPVQLPCENDGEDIPGAVLAKVDGQPRQTRNKLSPAENRAFNILSDLILDQGHDYIIKKGMPAVKVVRLDAFRTALKEGNLSASDKPDSVNKAITRAIEKLIEKGFSNTWKDYIWITGQIGQDRTDKNFPSSH